MGKLLDFVKREEDVVERDVGKEAKQQFLDLFTPKELDEIKKDLDRLGSEGGNAGD